MALGVVLDLKLGATLTKTAVMGNLPSDALNFVRRVELTTGVAAGQADKLYYAERQISPSANDDLDIVGVLLDNLGTTFSVARIKLLAVLAEPVDPAFARNTNDVLIGAAAATQWASLLGTTGIVRARPGALILAAAGVLDAVGYVAAGGSTDILRIANGGAGTTVNYQIIAIGASA